MDLMIFACALVLEGFRVAFGPVTGPAKQRPFTARRGAVVIHGVPGHKPQLEIVSPPRFTISS